MTHANNARQPARNDRPRVEIYDTTLRDGTQGLGVALSLVDKLKITRMLDDIGVDYIEGGYPLSNPKDVAYFEEAQKLKLKHAKVCAFGMTRRKGISPGDDPGMKALVEAATPVITIVGKTWDLHVDEVLRVSRDENLAMIRESLDYCRKHNPDGDTVLYDAEHFFDGYKANPAYALDTLRAALDGGAQRLVLCDTNGGALPAWITQAVREIRDALGQDTPLGIHVHNDGGLAVANTLAAVEVGCDHVQGTINGIGERCGNVDLLSVIANLELKLGYQCIAEGAVQRLTETSRVVYELANLNLVHGQPFVGSAAFAHKGGMHVHAVQRIAHSYEHIDPASVGNERQILVSELAGASNIAATIGDKFDLADKRDIQRKVLERVQDLEHQGYQFEAARASFELLVREVLGQRPDLWQLDHYRCVILKRNGEVTSTEATVKLEIDGETEHRVAEGDGPVNALDGALRKCLRPHHPRIDDLHLTDYKVRVVNPTAESAAKVRVMAEFTIRGDGPTETFTTIGVNENIVDASWQALADAFAYHLIEIREDAQVAGSAT
ncbi:citramalate synthase [Phycisphaerales bacterium AB-hyl4]|uniref:Citramalate synthase n=1 Tax=Natronomicrosphaera hydrolytica TaxID=3242702 RepID=A0ABV4U2Y4_9BACT